MKNVKVTLVKSLIARKPAQVANAKALGLNRPGDFVVVEENEALLGKIKVISHLVKVETV